MRDLTKNAGYKTRQRCKRTTRSKKTRRTLQQLLSHPRHLPISLPRNLLVPRRKATKIQTMKRTFRRLRFRLQLFLVLYLVPGRRLYLVPGRRLLRLLFLVQALQRRRLFSPVLLLQWRRLSSLVWLLRLLPPPRIQQHYQVLVHQKWKATLLFLFRP